MSHATASLPHRIAGATWWLGAALIALLITAPLTVVVSSLASEPGEGWALVSELLLPAYIAGTVTMVLGVGLLSLVWGVGAAWIVTVWEIPGRRFFTLALMLPMAIPTYVAAYAYEFAKTDIRDPLLLWLREMLGSGAMATASTVLNHALGIFVLSLVLYPYVFIAARVGFAEISGAYLENSRLLGRGLLRSLGSIGLPLARPAIIGGLMLVLLEVMNEYGAMLHFGIETLTTGIFLSWTSLGDRDSAIRLASVAMLIVFALIAAEQILRGRSRFHAHRSARRNLAEKPKTTLGTAGAFAFCSVLFLLAFVIPVWELLKLASHGLGKVEVAALLSPVGGSLVAALLAGVAILAAALFLGYAVRVFPLLAMKLLAKVCMLGYALPGAVVVIAMLVTSSALAKWFGVEQLTTFLFTMTPIGLIAAYAVRFMTPALAPVEAGLERISRNLDDASRILGRSSWGSFFRIHLPLLRLPLLGGLIVVFVDVLKELPLTLVLRPHNFETLATQTFSLMHKEERLAEGAIPALILVVAASISVVALHTLVSGRAKARS